MSAPKTYIETCPFIDMAKKEVGTLPSDREDDVWFCKQLLKAHRAGEVHLYTSSLTIAECQHADHIFDERVQTLFKKILTSGQYIFLVQDSILVAERARDMRWKHGLSFKGADAIHLASALEVGCTEFVSADGRYFAEPRKSDIFNKLGIRVIKAHESINLPEHYKQTSFYE